MHTVGTAWSMAPYANKLTRHNVFGAHSPHRSLTVQSDTKYRFCARGADGHSQLESMNQRSKQAGKFRPVGRPGAENMSTGPREHDEDRVTATGCEVLKTPRTRARS